MITDVRSVIYPFMPTNAFYINGTFAEKLQFKSFYHLA